jgi:hypothetical protein
VPIFTTSNPFAAGIFLWVTLAHYLQNNSCHITYLMQRSEFVVYLPLAAWLGAWVAGSWWCVLWTGNEFLLSNLSSLTRYNGSTGFGRYSPLSGEERSFSD